jgi:hypothetical protein
MTCVTCVNQWGPAQPGWVGGWVGGYFSMGARVDGGVVGLGIGDFQAGRHGLLVLLVYIYVNSIWQEAQWCLGSLAVPAWWWAGWLAVAASARFGPPPRLDVIIELPGGSSPLVVDWLWTVCCFAKTLQGRIIGYHTTDFVVCVAGIVLGSVALYVSLKQALKQASEMFTT